MGVILFLVVMKLEGVGGFIIPRYVMTEETNMFTLKYCRFHFKGEIAPFLKFFLQVETKKEDARLQNAFLNFYPGKRVEIRIGYIKVPFGLEGYGSSTKTITCNKSLPTSKLYEGSQDMGVHVHLREKFFQLYLSCINGYNGMVEDENEEKDVTGKLRITPIKGVGVGGSVWKGIRGKFSDRDLMKWGIEGEGKVKFVWVRGEYLAKKLTELPRAHWELFRNYIREYKEEGWYLKTEVRPPVRGEEKGKIGIVVGYGVYNDLTEKIKMKRTTLGLNGYFKGWNRVAINYEVLKEGKIKETGKYTIDFQFLF